MTSERFEKIKLNPTAYARLKKGTKESVFARWEAGDFTSELSASKLAEMAEKKKNADGTDGDSENPEKELSDEEIAEIVTKMMSSGQVPDFAKNREKDSFSIESENEFYYKSMESQEQDLTPNAPLKIRLYAAYLIHKYDKNGDGVLQETEWKPMEQAQAVDLNGDFQLQEEELVFFIARYAKNRSVFRPAPIVKRELKVTTGETGIKIRPLSGKPAPKTKNDIRKEKNGLSDLTEAEFRAMLVKPKDSDVDSEAKLELLLEDIAESKNREYAVGAVQLLGVPRWFIMRDRDGDGQLSLREYAPTLSNSAIAFFGRLDTNKDGFITPEEIRAALKPGGRNSGISR